METFRSVLLLTSMPEQRWQLPAAVSVTPDLRQLGLPDALLTLLLRRGHTNLEAIKALLDPPEAPDPSRHFPDLRRAVQRLRQACRAGVGVAICGHVHAVRMTIMALLVGLLQLLGADGLAAFPCPRDDGQGLTRAPRRRAPC